MFTFIGKEPKLFVVFSSWRPFEKINAKYYEFKNILTEIYPDAHKIFLIDTKNGWFINGIDSNFNSIGKILKYINEYVKNYKLTDLNFIGSSMGGFGALLYGKLYSIKYKVKTNILSFSPQTILVKDSEILKWNKWTYNCIKELDFPENNKLLDLNFVLSKDSDCYSCCICSENIYFDMMNINHIKPNISIGYKIIDTKDHNSAKILQGANNLNTFILNYKNDVESILPTIKKID